MESRRHDAQILTARIRRYRSDDAPALCALFFRSAREAGRLHYDERQVEAWAPSPLDPEQFHRHATDGRIVLVAVDEHDAPLAYGDLEADGHIDHLYCHPDVIGHGFGSALLEALESEAQRHELVRLYAEASEGALGLFLRRGFVWLGKKEFLLNGIPIHNHAVAKVLGDKSD